MRQILNIRRALSTEAPALLAIWERSVRASHIFLTEADIAFYRPLTAEILNDDALGLWVLADEEDERLVGFLGLAGHSIEALFLEPERRREGSGRRLVEHAQKVTDGVLTVDVNEQNHDACRFYDALGFVVVSRTAHDSTGRPYPILHLRRDTPRNIRAWFGHLLRTVRGKRPGATHRRRT
jgi:putative acetyltransferase